MKAWRWFALASMTACGACGADAGSNGGSSPESLGSNAELPERECEGHSAHVCSAGKFCATAQVNQCPGPKITGTCSHIPEACIDIYQPTCGCDGQTYGNECQAAVAGVAAAYDGPCAPSCGGFAGLPCPGNGTCVDNATDGCNPLEGDADCASLCLCEVVGLCSEGGRWDSSPEVCDCVWD